jgi:hypothetical protein
LVEFSQGEQQQRFWKNWDLKELGRNEVMDMVRAGKPFASSGVAQGKEDQGPMMQAEWCNRANCPNAAVTSLGEKNYCFDHFCYQCYELLERAEGETLRGPGCLPANREAHLALDECARRALEISLREMELNNLDRARLLDILLWSGDLTSALRMRRSPVSVTVAN